jgi:hypothetical protein
MSMGVTIGDCLQKARLISAEATLAHAIAMFQKHQSCNWLTLVRQKRPCGMVGRKAAFEIAATMNRSQLVKSPITLASSKKRLSLDANQPLEGFFASDDARAVIAYTTPGIIVRDKRFAGLFDPAKAIPMLLTERTTDQLAKISEHSDLAQDTLQAPLLGTLAHEIRTPLTGMMGLAEMLATRVRDAENRSIAKTIVRSGETLDRILKDTLDYASLGAGRLELQNEASDLNELVDDLRSLWAPDSARRNLGFTVSFVPDGPHRIETDLGRIRQIANNLVSNALKFTSDGEVSVTISTQSMGNTLMLSLAVTDTGRGLSGEDRARYLQAFEKGLSTDGAPGWGLGLSISQALAHHLGGTLNHADNPVGGSVFTLMVPVKVAKAQAWTMPPAPRRGKFELGDVLLIEDHEASAMVTIDALEQAGWTVHHAGTIDAAELYSTRTTFQAILTDLHLPDGNAMTLIDSLKRRQGPNTNTPIIVMTADITDGRRQACLAMGADRALKKPVAGPELVATLADVLMSKAAGHITGGQLRGRLAS